jgi:hypothetical protein
MDNDRLIALGLLKFMVDAGGVDFSLGWLVEKSGVTEREIERGLRVLEEWNAVVVTREPLSERPRVVSVRLSEERAYGVYREIFGHGPPS